MVTRRTFLKYTASGTALTLFGFDPLSGLFKAYGQIPGGTLAPNDIPKYQTPLLIPPVMPAAGKVVLPGGRPATYYEISLRQFNQQILPAPLDMTTVWGYGPVAAAKKKALLAHNAPSFTIEAQWNEPVRVKWINDLVDADGKFLKHLLPVDPSIHWANPPGGPGGTDMKPSFTETPGRYEGPVPMVTHLHGAIGVGDESDGYAEAWVLPNAIDIPEGYATGGKWRDFFAAKAEAQFGASWGPGYTVSHYPNDNRASTIWYHDHAMGMTRLNVYAGPAGFYILRGGPTGDGSVLDSRSGTPAVLPGPAPREGDQFPPNKAYHEIPLALQDRSFNSDGSLFYPDTRAFFDDITGPYIPTTDLPPIWNPEFFGNTLIVNGNTWPYLNVDQSRYRFRILNGCQSRFLILDFSAITGVDVWVIGNDGGFLTAPAHLTAKRLLIAPAERYDIIVDFGGVAPGNYVLRNVGPDEPFGGGEPDTDFGKADPGTTGQVMEFRVAAAVAPDTTTPPQFLVLPALPALPAATVTRPLALLEKESSYFPGSPAQALLGSLAGDPNVAPASWTAHVFMEGVTENPAVGATEVWEFYNATADAHPIHVHEIAFEVVNRQPLSVDETAQTVQVLPGSVPVPPKPWESGVKDTVIVYPGEVTRIRGRFNNPGQYVWHCHIVEHEDNEMMRPFRVGDPQPGQPT